MASRAGYAETTITLRVSVRALTAPFPVIGIKTGRFSGDVFDFSDAGYAGGVYQNASFREGGILSRSFDVGEKGQVVTTRDLEAGVFRIVVLAESPDYLGTATLGLSMTVRWRVEYGVDSGAGVLSGFVGDHLRALDSGELVDARRGLNFKARPSGTHYVSEWTGDCADAGQVGNVGAPGRERGCALTAEDNVRVGVVFLPGRIPGSGGVRGPVRRARTVAGYTGSVAFFAGEAGVTVRTPDTAPAGFDFETGAEFVSPAGFAVSLLSSPGAGKAATARFDAVVNLRDYLEGTIGLRVEVSVLEPSPPQSARTIIARGATFSAGGLHDFGAGDYAGAAFGKQSGADELTVSAAGVVSAQDAAAGLYTIVMTATSAAFLGTAAFRFDLAVGEIGPVPEADGIPPDLRAQGRSFAPGHTGSVGFFAAAGAGVTLRTPDSAPAGFAFETGADFVWPNGFAVSLTTSLRAGQTRVGAFSVVASRAGDVATTIPLRVTARAPAAPRPEIEVKPRPFSGTVFYFADAGYAEGAYQNASFREGGDLSAELDVAANGRVTTTGDLEPGIYGITALAESESDYTGTATLALLLTVGWRLEYVSAAAGGTVSAKTFGHLQYGGQQTVLSGAGIAPGRLIEFTAVPSVSHFVEDWTGACGEVVDGRDCNTAQRDRGECGEHRGQDGSSDNPGQSRVCVLKVESDVGVTAVFAEAAGSALFLFNGAGVRTTGQMVAVEHHDVRYQGSGYVLTLSMVYHGIQRNLHVMRLSSWAAYPPLSALRPIGGGMLVGSGATELIARYGFAAKTCRNNGWRVPTAGEVVGLSYSGDTRWPVAFAGGKDNLRANTAAGALRGLEIPVLTVSADADDNPVPDGFYELDSRDVNGDYAVVRYHQGKGDIRFPTATASRWIMCVRDAEGAVKSPELAAVLLESGGRRVGDPVDRGEGPGVNGDGDIITPETDAPPSFTVTATLHSTAASGDALFTGTVYSWKHKDAPEILRGARPLAAAAALAAGYDVVTTAAAGDSGTEIRILVGSPRPAAVAGRTTLFLRASHVLGVSATIAAVVEVEASSTNLRAVYRQLAVDGTRGALLATLSDGTEVVSGGEADYGEDLHVRATPEAGYYVHSWSGACVGAGAEVGSAGEEGEAKTCVVRNIGSPTVSVGVLFGRDECAVNSPCDANAACTDPDPLAADSAEAFVCACDAGYSSSDNGRTCSSFPAVPDAAVILPGGRTLTLTVAGGYAGELTVFAAAGAGVTLRTPDSAPAGFFFETGADFVSPSSFAISLSSALAAGETREGRFEVTASRAGNSATRIGLAVIVSALSAAPLAGVGLQVAPYSSDNIFDFSDASYAGGAYRNAYFSEAGALSADLDVSAGGRVSASSLGGGVYGVTVAAGRSPDYLGTATLTLRLTVGWRVEYGGDPAGDGEVTAADGSGSALASGSVAAPGAAVTFRATPSSGHYVSGWTGACGGASGPGQIGSGARPGESRACGLTVSAHINVTANFAEGGSDVLMFNGAVVQSAGQLVSVTLNNITVNSAANNLSVNMAYHGVLRNLHVMRLAGWLIGASGITGGTGAFPGAHFRNVGIAAGVCGRDGWRVPTVGEIVGLSKSGAGPEVVGRVAGSPSDYNVAPAGAAVGLSVPLPPAGADDNAASLPDELYEFDSRDAGGAYAVVRYRGNVTPSDISFAKTTANRKVICVKDADNAADSPDMAAVRLESGGGIAGNPVASSANPSPSFTVTATLSVSHSFGDGLFTGTVQAWKHKDAPVILSGSRPLVTAASGLATGYDIVITAAAGGSGTEVMVKVGSPRPLAIAGLTTLSLRAAAELGVTASIEVVVDVLGGRQFEAHYAAESFRGGARIGGLLATLRGGGAVAPGGRANRGEDLHVTATPEADYYVDSWTGACAGTGAEVGDALSSGEARTCVLANVQTASVTFGAVFGRDECAAAVSPCGENGACSVDPDHLTEGSTVECLCDSGFADDGSGFCAEIRRGGLDCAGGAGGCGLCFADLHGFGGVFPGAGRGDFADAVVGAGGIRFCGRNGFFGAGGGGCFHAVAAGGGGRIDGGVYRDGVGAGGCA